MIGKTLKTMQFSQSELKLLSNAKILQKKKCSWACLMNTGWDLEFCCVVKSYIRRHYLFYKLPVSSSVRKELTHYQTTNFRLFQTERVCRRQFQIWWKWQKVIQTGRKQCGKRRNCSLWKGFTVWEWVNPFPHNDTFWHPGKEAFSKHSGIRRKCW